MKKWMIVFFAFSTGCQTPLDIRQTELIDAWGQGNKAFAKAIGEYAKIMDRVAADYHRSQGQLRDSQWDLWLGRHTDQDGGLVFQDTDGEIKPMRVEQLCAALTLRDQAFQTIAESQSVWRQADATVKKAVDDFNVMTQVALSTNAEIADARKSAQRFAESALNALAGIAGGVGIGAALVP
ncbi:MAG: hypothetical protein ABII12_11355 [Planctomycetota bacterium]